MGKVFLVTGATGLVGSAVQQYVQTHRPTEQWHYISSKDADLNDLTATEQVFAKLRPTHVLHLAARVGGLFANMKSGVEFWRENICMQDNIMVMCKRYNVEKLVSCLSTCVFPDKTTYPITEDMVHLGPPHPSNEGYAYAKRMVDVQNRLYYNEYGCKFTSVIPTNIFGPFDNFSLTEGHVIPSLIHKCFLARKLDQPFVVAGSGTPLRQFIYSMDLAKLLAWTLDSYDDVSPIILSVDEADEVSIRHVATAIANVLDYKERMVFDIAQPDGQHKKTASNTKLRSLLPDFEFTPFNTALADTVQWFIQQYPNVRK